MCRAGAKESGRSFGAVDLNGLSRLDSTGQKLPKVRSIWSFGLLALEYDLTENIFHNLWRLWAKFNFARARPYTWTAGVPQGGIRRDPLPETSDSLPVSL